MERLLARIKALFGPSPPEAPPSEVEEAPSPAATVPELAETHLSQPTVTAPEAPPAEARPAVIADAPTVVEETPTVVEEAPATVAEAPTVAEETPIVAAEEAPAVVAESPAAVEEAPSVTSEAPTDVEPLVPAAPPGGLTLRLESARGPGSTFEVTKSGATIGRGPESTIQLADISVSRKHAKITYRQGAYWLSDLGSMGGTWIDGTKLAAPRRVATGQTIDIGLCRLTVVSMGAEEKSPAARGPSHAA